LKEDWSVLPYFINVGPERGQLGFWGGEVCAVYARTRIETLPWSMLRNSI
jgi:hypothetical protein